jgi:hypothetical protein
MKTVFFISLLCISNSVFAQFEEKETIVSNIFTELAQEQAIRNQLSGYVPDSNFIFVSILEKVAKGKLNIDSLSKKQLHLTRVSVNEYWDNHAKPKLLIYLEEINLSQYSDTSIYRIKYNKSIQYFGNISEYLSIKNIQTNVDVVSLTLIYELYSNIVRCAISDIF